MKASRISFEDWFQWISRMSWRFQRSCRELQICFKEFQEEFMSAWELSETLGAFQRVSRGFQRITGGSENFSDFRKMLRKYHGLSREFQRSLTGFHRVPETLQMQSGGFQSAAGGFQGTFGCFHEGSQGFVKIRDSFWKFWCISGGLQRISGRIRSNS